MIEIQDIGSALIPDSQGHLIKAAHKCLIQARWRPVVDEIIQFYQSQIQCDLLSVYIRGSVAKGTAVDGISDVDSFFISKSSFRLSEEPKSTFRRRIVGAYPFCNGVELMGFGIEHLNDLAPPKERSIWQELIKTQSACVYGKDLTETIAPFELKDMVAHAYWIEREIQALPADLADDIVRDHSVSESCAWIMKRLIRVGFEIVMLREQRWTRDLSPCFKLFSKYYPEHEALMKKALTLALNPSDSAQEVIAVVDQFKPWLFEEIRRHVPGPPALKSRLEVG